MSQYTHRVTIAVPFSLVESANHLACIMGESVADIGTFRKASWQDTGGNLYAVASAVVKPVFLGAASGVLPESPEHAIDADRVLAQQALDSLNQPGGLQMIVDINPFDALASLGLTLVPEVIE
jgi:hypothetical protein